MVFLIKKILAHPVLRWQISKELMYRKKLEFLKLKFLNNVRLLYIFEIVVDCKIFLQKCGIWLFWPLFVGIFNVLGAKIVF